MVILDISMPNIRGIKAIREIKTLHPGLKILVLTIHQDMECLHQAISSGAHGYLLNIAELIKYAIQKGYIYPTKG